MKEAKTMTYRKSWIQLRKIEKEGRGLRGRGGGKERVFWGRKCCCVWGTAKRASRFTRMYLAAYVPGACKTAAFAAAVAVAATIAVIIGVCWPSAVYGGLYPQRHRSIGTENTHSVSHSVSHIHKHSQTHTQISILFLFLFFFIFSFTSNCASK